MDIAKDLAERGLIEQTSAPLDTVLGSPRTVYLGVDPSADSMQAGNLAIVLLMKRLADAGNRIILLVGGGTGMIGDPRESGERVLADKRIVNKNKRALRAQMQRIIGTKVTLVDNADWLLKVKLVDFLRDIGKHFTVNELIKRDIIRRRLETPDESISYTEFAYSLLQGYDYMTLNQKYGCDLQVGGNDQWTNLLSGVELIRRKLGKEAFALTIPLVTDAAGKKFGKSEGNAIWLDAQKTSPFAFYQFWVNQPDDVVRKYLKFYTFISVPEIDALLSLHAGNPGKREAQKRLAYEVTALVHGESSATRCEAASDALYGGASLGNLSKADLATIMREAKTTTVAIGSSVVDALVATELASSKSDARRLIDAKGVTLADTVIDHADATITADLFTNRLALLKRGRTVAVLLHS